MSESATKVLAGFESLRPHEQHEVVTLILRRTGDLPDRPFDDDGLTAVADLLFQSLDAEEAGDADGEDSDAG